MDSIVIRESTYDVTLSYQYFRCEREQAPTILFVHGFPLDHSMWSAQVELQDRFSLLIPDLPGFGGSGVLMNTPGVARYADALAALVRGLEIEPVVFCGLSMGGYIGWEFFARHRELVSHLVCCNTKADADDEVTQRARQVSAAAALKNGVDQACEAMLPKLFAPQSITNLAMVEPIEKAMKSCPPETFGLCQLMMAERVDHAGTLERIDVPTLVIAGEHDPITPPDLMQRMADRIPDSRFEKISGAGHLSPLECPRVFNELIGSFLIG